MNGVRAERRLAAILAADIVGYSRMIEADEAASLAAIGDLRRAVIDPLLAERRGRIVKVMGDGVIAEFNSVVDSVVCAVAMQRGVAKHQSDEPPGRRIVFRIGINLGDVVVDGDDLLGDGVNIAARLEQLCEPGGVMVSGTAFDHLQGRLGLPLEDAGEQQVKNIARPVRAYRVRMDGSRQRWRSPLRRLLHRRRLLPTAAAFLILLPGAVGLSWLRRPEPANNGPSVAVLPFANMSGDPAQDYFGRGVAEEVITALSTFPTIRVVSRMSSFVYDKPAKAQEVARDLGVRYVLEGSARKGADRARVTAQLIDASTGLDLWADKYDAEGADVVMLQEDVAAKIYNTIAGLKGRVRQDEEQQAWRKSSLSLTEYDYYLRGHQFLMMGTPEDCLRARKIWQEGLERFPASALLKIKLGFTYMQPVLDGWSSDPKQDIETAWQIASAAASGENKSRLETWLGHWLMAQMYAWHENNYERAADEAEAAVQMVPYDSMSRAGLMYFVANASRTAEAISWGEDVARRDPRPPPWLFGNLAWAYYLTGRYEDALAANKKTSIGWLPIEAAILVRLGRIDDARSTIARFLKQKPGFTLTGEADFPAPDSLKQPYLDDVRKAGLPDK